jgi:chaperonin cofactor prefoldin
VTQEEKLKREKEIRLGQLCEEWMDKVGKAFLQSEKEQILAALDKAMPNELPAVQARYKEVQNLMNRITNIINDKNRAARKVHDENRRE